MRLHNADGERRKDTFEGEACDLGVAEEIEEAIEEELDG